MTFKELLKKYLREDSMDYSILSNINYVILDEDLVYGEVHAINFKSCSLEDVKELLYDKEYPVNANTIFDEVTGRFELSDFKLQYVTFINSNLDYIEFGYGIVDVGINKCNIDVLHFKECDKLDYFGLFDCKIDHLIIGECKIEEVDIKKCELDKAEIFDSFINSLQVRESNIKDCHSLEDLKEVIFTKENLNKESDGRGLASIYDTGLFDFKIK